MIDQPEHADSQPPDKATGWHDPVGATPYQDRQQWFVPPQAASREQLDALRSSTDLDQAMKFSDVISGIPSRPGAWYSPQGSAYNIQPATSLSGLISTPSSDLAPLAPLLPDIEPAIPLDFDIDLADEIEPEIEPVVPTDEQELAYRAAPYVLGEIETGFNPAPEIPLSAMLEAGEGGLRDEPATVVGDTPSLSLEEAAAQEEQLIEVEVPARGLGGIQDVPAPETGPITATTDGLLSTSSEAFLPSQQVTQPYTENIPAQNQIQGSAMSQSNQSTPPSAQRFREVEQAVQALRQQFAQGQITRIQLETELRRLMVMDEQGRWWTLGVDSNRWYRYDGREWVPDVPPQTGAYQAVLGVPTETGVQVPASASGFSANVPSSSDVAAQASRIAIDNYGMPLPQRVPQEDPGATMVNIAAFTARADEPTMEGAIPSPVPIGIEAATLRPDSPESRISPDEAARVVLENPNDPYAINESELTAISDQGMVENKAKKAMSAQGPDYSEALGGSLTRSGATKFAVWGGIIGVVSVLGITLCVLLAMVGYYFSVVNDYSEAIDSLPERASTFETSTLYASDNNTILMQINDPVRGPRQKVSLGDISPWALHALVSTEDETFYENPGFSVFAIMRAAYTNFRGGGVQSGASTITQQLSRRLLLNEDFASQVSASRKMTEIILAAEISRKYSKNEILELYFNEISFGGYTVGIEAAAQAYFDKPASELDIFESALLVGLVQSPAVYDPFRNRELALGRMETVLRLMQEANGTGCIQMDHTFNGTGFDLSQPLCVTESYLINDVPHLKAFVETRPFDPPINELRYAHFAFWARDELFSLCRSGQLFEGCNENTIYNRGLRVITTIDPAVQNAAQQAVVDQISIATTQWGTRVNNGSVVAIDPGSGAVVAMVGSANFRDKSIDGEVNVALTDQQPGSSIKPLVYLTSFEGYQDANGVPVYYTPGTVLWDVPSDWSGYQPTNFDLEYHGPMSIRTALSNSYNIPAVKALQFVTPARFEQVANRTGITFSQSPVQVGLPAALGAAEVHLIDQVAAYGAFANNGIYNRPYGIERVETLDGDVLYDALVNIDANSSYQTMDPTHAFLINSILSDPQARRIEFGGVNYDYLDLPNRPAAVKTGSSNDDRDSLTIGWTPQMIVGVWMGNTDNSPPGGRAGGFYLATPVWNKVMKQALDGAGLPVVNFVQPPGVIQQQICVDSGTLVPNNNASLCGPGGVTTEYFLADQPPPSAEQSDLTVIQVDAFTNLLANQFCPDYVVDRLFLNVDDPTVVPWLRDSLAGQQWAAARSIDINNLGASAPEGECQAGQEVPIVILNSPFNGMTVSRLVTFTGQASAPNFGHYEFQYAPATAPNQFGIIPGQTYQFAQAAPGSTLGTWDSTGLANGQYNIRLVVFGTLDGAVATSPSVLVTINNNAGDPFQPSTEEAVPNTEGLQ